MRVILSFVLYACALVVYSSDKKIELSSSKLIYLANELVDLKAYYSLLRYSRVANHDLRVCYALCHQEQFDKGVSKCEMFKCPCVYTNFSLNNAVWSCRKDSEIANIALSMLNFATMSIQFPAAPDMHYSFYVTFDRDSQNAEDSVNSSNTLFVKSLGKDQQETSPNYLYQDSNRDSFGTNRESDKELLNDPVDTPRESSKETNNIVLIVIIVLLVVVIIITAVCIKLIKKEKKGEDGKNKDKKDKKDKKGKGKKDKKDKKGKKGKKEKPDKKGKSKDKKGAKKAPKKGKDKDKKAKGEDSENPFTKIMGMFNKKAKKKEAGDKTKGKDKGKAKGKSKGKAKGKAKGKGKGKGKDKKSDLKKGKSEVSIATVDSKASGTSIATKVSGMSISSNVSQTTVVSNASQTSTVSKASQTTLGSNVSKSKGAIKGTIDKSIGKLDKSKARAKVQAKESGKYDYKGKPKDTYELKPKKPAKK